MDLTQTDEEEGVMAKVKQRGGGGKGCWDLAGKCVGKCRTWEEVSVMGEVNVRAGKGASHRIIGVCAIC